MKRDIGDVVDCMNVKIENKIISWLKIYKNILFFGTISFVGLIARYLEVPFLSGDMQDFLIPWFNSMKKWGG